MITIINLDENYPDSKKNIDAELLELLIDEVEWKTLWDRSKPETMINDTVIDI